MTIIPSEEPYAPFKEWFEEYEDEFLPEGMYHGMDPKVEYHRARHRAYLSRLSEYIMAAVTKLNSEDLQHG